VETEIVVLTLTESELKYWKKIQTETKNQSRTPLVLIWQIHGKRYWTKYQCLHANSTGYLQILSRLVLNCLIVLIS